MNKKGFKTTLYLLIFTLLSLPLNSAEIKKAENSENKINKINYNQYLALLKKRLPELQKNRLEIEKAKNRIQQAKAASDIFLTAKATHFQEYQYGSDYTYRDDYSRGFQTQVGISKNIAQTGTNISTGFDYTSQNHHTSTVNGKYYSPAYYVEVKQPILKNAFGIVDRYSRNDAEMKLKIEKLKSIETEKEILNYYQKLYFDWIEYSERLNLLKSTINSAKSLMQQTKRKHQKGLADNDDYQNTRSAYLKYLEQYKADKLTYEVIKKNLKPFLDVDNLELDKTEFTAFFKESSKYRYDFKKFSETRNSKIYSLSKENLAYAKFVANNQLLPELNIIGNVKFKSNENQYSEAINNINSKDYYIGFEFRYPLENSEARSNSTSVDLEIKALNKEYEISKNSYDRELNKLLTTIKSQRAILAYKKQIIKVLNSKYRTEKSKYRHARLNLSYLVQTNNEITHEKISMLQLKKLLIHNYLNYKYLTE